MIYIYAIFQFVQNFLSLTVEPLLKSFSTQQKTAIMIKTITMNIETDSKVMMNQIIIIFDIGINTEFKQSIEIQQLNIVINYLMSVIQQELILTNILSFNFSHVEEKLKKNFEILSYRVSRLQQALNLEDRVRNLEKQSRFMNIKIDSISQRLPQTMIPLQQQDVIKITSEKFNELLNSDKQNLKSTKLFQDLRQTIERSIQQKNTLNTLKKQVRKISKQQQIKKPQHFIQQGQNIANQNIQLKLTQRLTKEHLQKYLNKEEVGIVEKIFKQNKNPDQLLIDLALKMEKLERYIEEQKISKGVLESVQKDTDKFQKYESYEDKFTRYEKKFKKDQSNLKDSRKMSRKIINVEELKNQIPRNQEQHQLGDKQKTPDKTNVKNRSSIKFILPEKIEKRLRIQDNKDINSVLKEIQSRLESKVTKETFINFVQDFEEKLQHLKHSKTTNDMYQYKKTINSFQNRLQAIISFIQQVTQDDDPLIVKKKWSCISCDKQAQKYSAKLGNHINWQSLNSKKLSPTKAGAFGQTVLFASKVKSIVDLRKGQTLQ